MKVIHLVCLSALLGGCSIFPSPEPQTQYTLVGPSPTFEGSKVFHSGLLIKAPATDASLKTQEIAVSPEQGTRTYIAGALWTDQAPLMFQNLLIQGFENSTLFPNVGAPGSGVTAQLILQSHLRDFSVHYENGFPVVCIDLFAKILSLKTREVVDSQKFIARIAIEKNNLMAIRNGFQEATDKVILEVIRWILSQNEAEMIAPYEDLSPLEPLSE